MSAYRGRTGPNYTEFLQGLNATTPPEQEPYTGELELGGDLEMFTNANFTHQFDMPALEENAFSFNIDGEKPGLSMKYEDLLAGGDPTQGFHAATIGNSPSDSQFYSNYNTPIQPAPAHGFGSADSQSPQLSHAPGRKLEPLQTQGIPMDEKSRVAAEEDKRRRNTAASARFRVKKKQREQALERSVKDVSDKNNKLEAKISQLEMENKWLKDLITEKNAIQSREEIDAAYQKFKRESEERENEQHTTGVGTN